jgi:hypothetical protein
LKSSEANQVSKLNKVDPPNSWLDGAVLHVHRIHCKKKMISKVVSCLEEAGSDGCECK